MTAGKGRIIVVGAGILGTMHAIEAVHRGFEVVQFERDLTPKDASVRNFGLIWVGGRAPGAELELALHARERWEAIAATSPGVGFRPNGSVTIAESAQELAVLEEVCTRADAPDRGFRLLEPAEARQLNPSLSGAFLGALHCSTDATVEPRTVLGALQDHLRSTGLHQLLSQHEVTDIAEHRVRDQAGTWHRADLVICCPGAHPGGALSEALEGAPLGRVRLQMLETAPHQGSFPTSLANGESLRYYPAYRGGALDRLCMTEPQSDLASQWGMQLLVAKRLSGHLTIGDTHLYGEPFPFDAAEAPGAYLLAAARRLCGDLPPVERRWLGTYSEVTDDRLLYYRAEIAPGVVVVTGAGGRGMTMSPAIAEESFE